MTRSPKILITPEAASATAKDPKIAELDSLIGEIKSSMKAELVTLKDVEIWVPTDIPQLDIALGGGIPVSRMTTLIGRKSVGKSTLCVHILAQLQKMGGIAVGLDAERSNMKTRCEKQGLDMSRFIPSQPESLDTFEREDFATGKKIKVKGAFDITEDLIKMIVRKAPKMLVGIALDSIAGASVASEKEGDVGDATMGKHARILSQAFRMQMPYVHDYNILFLLVNQLKSKIGVMFGSPDTYIGKNPIDFHSAITLEMTSGGPFPSKEAPVGIITKVFVSKNKVANPFSRVEYTTFFDRGIDPIWESLEFLSKEGLLGSTKGWCEYKGEKFRKTALYDFFREHPASGDELINWSRRMVHEKLAERKISVDDSCSEVSEEAAA